MKKTILKISLTCLIIRVVLFCTTFGAVCAENTTTSTQTLQQVMQNGNVYDLMSYVSRKYASFPDSWGGSPITGWSYDAYADWLDQKGLSSQLQEEVTITEGASGGRSYNIPQDLRETMVQYVQETYINENPLTYTECYIHTYNMVNVQWFPTYQLYQTWKSWASQQDGFILTKAYIANGTTQGIRACVIPKTNDINFVGTTTGGVFSNVAMYLGWSTTNTPWTVASGAKWVEILNNGTIRDFNGAGQAASTLGNTTNINDTTTSRMTIWTNLPKDEKVYVFNSLNALKAYNSASPQPYYFPTGSTLSVPYNDVFTDEDLLRAGSYYNSIVDNSQSGWTADQVLALVDKILGAGSYSGTNNAGTNNDDSFSLGFLGKIGEVIAAVTGSITPVSDLVEEGIKNFLEDVFGWLPPEIVALWIAGITFAVFFGILRVIRG